ncbi:chitin synthase-domain-containing protein [Chytriomyces sp. MP71]|nr:chitin synthase-domain-containing protein [Chytriomyces sp. MP71]
MVAVIKCGKPSERALPNQTKAGNRGKRDSQLILMNLFSHVVFNDAMTALDFDLMAKIYRITGHSTNLFQLVLMVDADTVVAPESLKLMSNVMSSDIKVMGLCGDTRVANPLASWVTAIQVFEYFISHHLGKSFESSFGGVTCLPGCFSMYRISLPKGPGGAWTVPVLVNPDIVHEYGENRADTLHLKNLLLLGEDRYLTTLMLRTFPKRKLVFVPEAICKTVVPDTFRTLLSQRRRWINSTVHNLYELMLMRDLCGVFCFSMQFIVFFSRLQLELVGTMVLPAALVTLITQLAFSAFSDSLSSVSVCIMSAMLFLPGILTSGFSLNPVNIFWMILYFASLPVWNIVLPLWAFWHFDDFTWGETRRIEGSDTDMAQGSQSKNEYAEEEHILYKT